MPVVHGFPGTPLDIVYVSKIFSFSPDYPYGINAGQVIKGGSGYSIKLPGGKEVYDGRRDMPLPDGIETIYPDYSLYENRIPEVRETAYMWYCSTRISLHARTGRSCLSSLWKAGRGLIFPRDLIYG